MVKTPILPGMGTRALDPQRLRLRQLLRELRCERGVHQADLAAEIGQPQSFVSKYESGERRLEFVMVEAICGALGLSLSEFWERWESGRESDSP